MPDLYRGMFKDGANNQPQTGNVNGNTLGVRPADVQTYDHAGVLWVNPTNVAGQPQGMSVTPTNGCDLPAHRRPKNSNWNGTGSAALVVWKIASPNLPTSLQYLADAENSRHGFVAPAAAGPLAIYQGNVQGTAPQWIEVAPPDQPCANAAVSQRKSAMTSSSLTTKIHEAIAARSSDDLVTHILQENKSGLGRDDIISGIEAEILGLEAASRDDAVEMLRTVLDRITGFCGPHLKMDLK